jgi:phosphatidate cytidylyltransferase
MSLRQRFPTATVLLVVLFVVLQWTPPVVFFCVLQVIIVIALTEFYGLADRRNRHPRLAVGIPLAFLISAAFYVPSLPLGLALFGVLFLSGLYFLATADTVEKVVTFPAGIALTVFGAVYISFTVNHLYLIQIERGPVFLYFFFGVIFLGDSGSFLFGKLWGRHKMTPLASPNKTWEGSAGGLLFAVLGAVAARTLLLKQVGWADAALCGLFLHAVAQISDPVESLFKRAAGVKDSSNILPGHGGFLDRIDSLLFAAPFFYYVIRYFWN